MSLYQTIAGIRSYLEPQRLEKSIALVPTMGALHLGHVSLIENAIAQNDLVVVSIFVNPLQFGVTEDLDTYPRQLEQDYQLCKKLGVNAVFAPTPSAMGITENSNSVATTLVVPPSEMISVLCGKYRQGHFQGVATIVTKLFNIIQPTRAYFGKKDAQQLAIIRRLVTDLCLPVTIQGCPTIRDTSGLALSSRNQYLTPQQREQAVILFRSLRKAQALFKTGEYNSSILKETLKQELASVPDINVQYIDLVDPVTLAPLETIETAGLLAIAVYIDSTRLIDNMILHRRQPIIAVDGPAGAGKSTVTKRIAKALGLLYLDTGAMYRAVTWLVLDAGIPINDEPAVAELVSQAKIELIPTDATNSNIQVTINGQDVTEAIRTPEVTAQVSAIAAQAAVRQALVKQQQNWGEKGGVIAEGRDIGTHVFPDAELKVFVTASVQERARRRWEEWKNREDVTLEQLEADIQQRDTLDSTRKISPLCKADDAVEVVTDDLSIEEVTARIIELYQSLDSIAV